MCFQVLGYFCSGGRQNLTLSSKTQRAKQYWEYHQLWVLLSQLSHNKTTGTVSLMETDFVKVMQHYSTHPLFTRAAPLESQLKKKKSPKEWSRSSYFGNPLWRDLGANTNCLYFTLTHWSGILRVPASQSHRWVTLFHKCQNFNNIQAPKAKR